MKLKDIKRYIMTGISYMVPLVVGAGLCQALGVILGGPDIVTASEGSSWIWYIYKTGNLAMGTLIIPVVCAYIAFSIADRPGIAPGLVVGLIAGNVKAGFLGGIIGAFMVGYFANLCKKIKLPQSMQGLLPILIIPFLTSLVCGFLMWTIVGQTCAAIINALTSFIEGLSTGSKFLYGAAMSFCSGTDFGGPVNKTISLYSTAMLADGIYQPKACHMVACMIPPMGVLITWLLSKIFKKEVWTKDEKENLKACFPMGICMITECVIPLAMNDLWRVVLSSQIGGAIAGGLCMIWDVQAPVPHGGWFVIPTFTHPEKFVIALIIGSVIMGTILFLLKKPIDKKEKVEENKTVAEVNIEF